MMIIQHRANDHKGTIEAEYAEMDVWMCDDGKIRLKHDVKGDANSAPPILLSDYLAAEPFDRYLVNIKQSLSISDLARISDSFLPFKLIGFFDVPTPLAILADKHFRIFHRRSEFERNTSARFHWLDPLLSQSLKAHQENMEAKENDLFIVACPSLHGTKLEVLKPVWEWVRDLGKDQFYLHRQMFGIVTKYPAKAKEFFND